MLANVASLVFAVLHGTADVREEDAKRVELRTVVGEALKSAAGVLSEEAVVDALTRALDAVERV